MPPFYFYNIFDAKIKKKFNTQSTFTKKIYNKITKIFGCDKRYFRILAATMKYIYQFAIISVISLVGELLNRIIPLPIPASIYGMIILFTALATGLLKLSAVKETGKFLIYIMPLMFIPPTVGLVESWGIMQEFLTAIIVISLISTIAVLGVSGHITQFIIRLKEKGGKR